MSAHAVGMWWAIEYWVVGVTIGASGLLGMCLRKRSRARTSPVSVDA